ncbi:hypothetical protein EVW72_07805 [Campylobacter jejuni]|uniref:hypothetical protein n=1 Tax=Campylobacter jejuni TaxID=197 RepID=UPI0017AD9370|nr:hypothetical protein [Campylobacter jejuni]EAH8607705.1 hypothetical protein [Campylobacter jejuni]EIY4965499.1 hypothetical protein [Campylobacter jejuni]
MSKKSSLGGLAELTLKKTIKALFFKLDNDEAKELLNELNETIKSDKEWQEMAKSINGDER